MLGPDAAKESRIFALQTWIIERFRTAWLAGMEGAWTTGRGQRAIAFSSVIPAIAVTVVGLVLAGRDAAAGDITLEAMSIAMAAMLVAGSTFVGGYEEQLAFGLWSLPSAVSIEQRVVDAARTDVGSLPADGLPAWAITFDHVRFSYPGTETDVFEDLSLEFIAGRSHAIVGLNGAGKTTLVKLLARLYEPTAGTIAVDAVALNNFDAAGWRRRMAVLFQDFVHYELPARDNVGFGALKMLGDYDALRKAARDAGAVDIVDRLSSDWDTILSSQYEGGTELSGGEWQRIALARALLAVQAGATVIVLDEPTASLDVRSEAALFSRFLELTLGLTVVLISHRFSSVRHVDQIFVVDGGRVVEQGSHAELLAVGGEYARMFDLQAKRFTDAEPEPEQVKG